LFNTDALPHHDHGIGNEHQEGTKKRQVEDVYDTESVTIGPEREIVASEDVSGHSKPATKGRMKTSHFEGSIASWAATAALGRNERTQRELAAFDIDFGGQRLVQPADCA
jgi:hypothetical protein